MNYKKWAAIPMLVAAIAVLLVRGGVLKYQRDAEDECSRIAGMSFLSVRQYANGMRPPGTPARYSSKSVRFEAIEPQVEWSSADMVFTASYTCDAGVISIKSDMGSFTATYNEDGEVLTWGGEEYKPSNP